MNNGLKIAALGIAVLLILAACAPAVDSAGGETAADSAREATAAGGQTVATSGAISELCTNDSQVVSIQDARLLEAIQRSTGSGSSDLTCSEMGQITNLFINASGIQSLAGLEYAHQLQGLYAFGNDVTDLSPLAGLTNLRQLHLNQSSDLSDLSPLAGLTGLETLLLTHASITDIAPLAGLSNLRVLHLNENSIEDYSVLTGLTGLTELGLSIAPEQAPVLRDLPNLRALYLIAGSHTYDSFDPFSGLADLEVLSIQLAAGTDISGISNLVNLRQLAIWGRLDDISPLAGLARLERLEIELNGSIGALAGLGDLTELVLSGEIVDAEVLAQLPALTSLRMWFSGLQSLAPVAGLVNLTSLELPYNELTDISDLSNLGQLEVLDLSDNRITDLSPLSGLSKLQRVNLANNYISDIEPLLQNTDITGAFVDVRGNCLELGSGPTRPSGQLRAHFAEVEFVLQRLPGQC